MILNYRMYGQGNPESLIILHGLFGSADNWQTFAKSVADQFQVIAMDIRNHGLSPHHQEFNYELISQDLYETAEYLQLDSFCLMGHSMGGKAAAHFALNYPGKVTKLIVIDIAMGSYPPHHTQYFDALKALDLNKINLRTEADEALSQYISDPTIRQFLLKSLARDTDGKFKWRFNLQALHHQYDHINVKIESAASFNNPTLIIRGEKSDYIKPADIELIKQLFPAATIQTVAQAGHWVHADQPESLREVVVKFLK